MNYSSVVGHQDVVFCCVLVNQKLNLISRTKAVCTFHWMLIFHEENLRASEAEIIRRVGEFRRKPSGGQAKKTEIIGEEASLCSSI